MQRTSDSIKTVFCVSEAVMSGVYFRWLGMRSFQNMQNWRGFLVSAMSPSPAAQITQVGMVTVK